MPEPRSLTLTWPISVNALYATVQGRRVLTKKGRQYHEAAWRARLMQWGRQHLDCLTNRLALTIEVYEPDRRRRDISNLVKVIEDALQHARVYQNDSQIDVLHVVRQPERAKPGKVIVTITILEE